MNLKRYEQYMILRRKKKIKLSDVAEYCGCSISALSQYETGKIKLKKDKLEKYMNYIDEKAV